MSELSSPDADFMFKMPTREQFARAMVGPDIRAYLPKEQLRAQFAGVGATSGGGIGACTSAFIVTLLRVDQVSLYDGSLMHWNADPNMPMETTSTS